MKIYTKTGDAGDTGLFGGSRVPKDHVRVEAYGAVDELNAALGLAASLEPRDAFADLFPAIQRDLFTMGAELASPEPATLAKAHPSPLLADANVRALEDAIDAHESSLEPLKSFILPGGAPKAAALHLARTVCRRAERSVVRLTRESPVSPALLRYLNRLSDLLFVLARKANAEAGRPDIKWR